MDRRRFLQGALGANMLACLPADLLARATVGADADDWDAGSVRHLLPTVSDSRMLIKVSFVDAQSGTPELVVDDRRFAGQMNDSHGQFWQFHADDLQAGRNYTLQLRSDANEAICEPWQLATFPAPAANVDSFRLLIYSSAGGVDSPGYLSATVRSRILRRALSFGPQAVVACGEHVYSSNEALLNSVVTPQIVPVCETAFRSTPTFFLQDDHNQLTQKLYYPEFLPNATRPSYLPWSSSDDRVPGLSESFGTLRYGDLAEVLLYDVHRTRTAAGPTSVFIDPVVESWLKARNRAIDTRHLVHVPSSPLGWSAGKHGEWYPDMLDNDGRLTTALDKPHWQQGWLAQHDRIVKSLANMRERSPLVVSGDLDAMALGRMMRSGDMDLSSNPINIALAGSINTSEKDRPSAFRGTGLATPAHVDIAESLAPIEQHGFTIVDFARDETRLRFFRWDVESQHPDEIDDLLPFHSAVIPGRGSISS